jgi:hypothetical protein
MRRVRNLAAAAVIAMSALGLAGCGNASAPPATSHQQAQDELGDIQRMLDSVDADMAGDDSQ